MLQGVRPHGPRGNQSPHHHGFSEAAIRPDATGVDATDTAMAYTVEIGVGDPETKFTLLVDTGTSNTWVGADKKYVATKTSKNTGDTVSVNYGTGSFSGTEFLDKVTISPDLIIEKQSIGVASESQGISAVDGVFGIGPIDLTKDTVSGQLEVPTVLDNMTSQGIIKSNVLGIFFEPTVKERTVTGELTFGGFDQRKITSNVTFTPITTVKPAAEYWGIKQNIKYGKNLHLLSGSAGVVDTGTTLLVLATDAYQAYQKATGGVVDETTTLLKVTEEQYNNLQSLYFEIDGTTFEMTPNAQIWPRSQNVDIGGDPNSIYLIASDLGQPSGEGIDFVNGFTFLQRFYSVFDTDKTRVGFATTAFTHATTN
ncbi:uncharacterized protein PHACADRAFT_108504 [Phanerochaete carnosa HHB-10118-sp]|uniref:Peptidase A1 domain-containing protein n=1 Tax=Phanerochaete carnosa (strain HHB-10118-sp) TaxID=650164 RepID=K5UGQ0_PHACS|nr:uncharacterized protein PHACADRAFT_108504 [Phanerochaete carnosa HHB-10118-sp]EKM48656.1 hypothetical protein PHACADRAFT_108504 [Phanerochaete carnosa HHB-10118-sp]